MSDAGGDAAVELAEEAGAAEEVMEEAVQELG